MGTFENASIQTDADGHVCQLNHLDEPFRPAARPETRRAGAAAVAKARVAAGAAAMTVRELADEYMQQAIPHFDLNEALLTSDGAEGAGAGMPERLVFHDEKSLMGNATVTYMQTVAGIPVWESGFVVQVEEEPMQVIGSQSTFQHSIQVQMPPSDAPYEASRIDAETLSTLMGFDIGSQANINHKEQFVYQYLEANRFEIPHEDPMEGEVSEQFPLPPVAQSIQEGAAYVVTAVQFTRQSNWIGEEGWLALIEPTTGSILYLRSLAGCGMHVTLTANDRSTVDELVDKVAPAAEASGDDVLPSVVFFDIGETLGRGVFSPPGTLAAIHIFPNVPEILKELTEKKLRLGIISNPGNLDTALINSLLQDADVFQFLEGDLVHYGPKDTTTIFTNAATAAGVTPQECAFVGENQAERDVAADAGFHVLASPDDIFAVVDPDASLAWVYLTDPNSKLGRAGPGPTASTAALNRMRDLVTLRGLTPAPQGTNQRLSGEYIRLEDIELPSPTIPSSPPPGDFRFSVSTNDFGAVNAYHNCDRLFRILEDFDIDVRSYFDGTVFPVRVDHRVRYGNPPTANTVNASAPGRRFPTPQSDGFRFALAAKNTAVGMATAWRVVLHEFGHALLWDNVGSPNFRFAHSAGDSLAAILNDPGNQALRSRTFPWVSIGRSHMRPVTEFAWFGTRYEPFNRFGSDRAGYVAEQMLSSTMFRVYQAAGGDSSVRADQEFAASYVAFLIIKAIGLMSLANNPSRPEGYADLLMQADTGSFKYEGAAVQIGVLRKVIRWAFELQGAYRQPPSFGQPRTNQVGNPPQVDVFVNDGRDGHYHYSDSIDAVNIWNRQASDNGTVHQDPVVGQENFAFVRLSNRGISTANNISVQALQSPLPMDQIWPDDWRPLATPTLQSQAPIPPGNELIVGPFKWVPASSTPTVLMSVSAAGDSSNLDRFTTANPIAIRLLARLDNNIGLRTMATATLPFVTQTPAPTGQPASI